VLFFAILVAGSAPWFLRRFGEAARRFWILSEICKYEKSDSEEGSMKLSRTFIALLLFCFGVGALQAQTPTPSSQSEDCGHFVQQFYNWYMATETALMKRNGLGSALEVTLREKRSSLSPELVKGLKEDLAASKKSPAEIVGLDFDPFLNAQDIAERYLVGNVTPKGDHYWVEVFGVWNGQKSSNPDVVPELAFDNGHWIFTNFHYGKTDIPANENLISILEVLKKDRQKAAK
jgi:Protein of unknown function (DUF3828)